MSQSHSTRAERSVPRDTAAPPFVVHVITSLEVGGAQTVLAQLAARAGAMGIRTAVISLAEPGPMAARIAATGVPVESMRLRPSLGHALAVASLARRLRSWQPDIVHTWLYHADLFGGLAARVAKVPQLYWNLRATALAARVNKWTTALTVRLCASLSRTLPDRIVACSQATRDGHADLGYDRARMLVIDNGVDTTRFRPNPAARHALRQQLAIPATARVVGLVARAHPMKNHACFLAALAPALRANAADHAILCGLGVEAEAAPFRAWLAQSGLGARVHLLGERTDVPDILAALDIHVSASTSGEGFSNAVLEAMAVGLPNVVTDVGDSRRIVGETGWVVPPDDESALAGALASALAGPPASLAARAAAARERTLNLFSVERMVEAYRRLYRGDNL